MVTFSDQEVREAVRQCNFNKGLGPDGFHGGVMVVDDPTDAVTNNLVSQIRGFLDDPATIPAYLREGRLVPLSKNKGKDQALLKDIGPIVVRSHLAKVLEKAALAKIEARAPHLLSTKQYQTGFKEATSTAANATRFIEQIHPGRGKRRRRYAALIDL